jgi:site-specific recombinase XerD
MRSNQAATRLGVVRRFAMYLQTIDLATEMPATGVFPTHRRRPTPYLWSQADIGRLMDAARALRSPLRAVTHEAPFGLLAASGMRIGEAVALGRDAVDLDRGVIVIHEAKSDRSRFVPVHPSTTAALRCYAAERDRLCP